MNFAAKARLSPNRLARCLRVIRGFWTESDLVAAHDISPHPWCSSMYVSTGSDPQFLVARDIPAGWYMLEVGMEFSSATAEVRIYMDDGSGHSEQKSNGMRVRSGSVRKRLVRLQALSAVRFDPMPTTGEFSIPYFRLVRVSARFARKVLVRKVLGGRQDATLGRALSSFSNEDLWQSYCRVMEPRNEAADYGHWIEDTEKPAIPTLDQQLATMAQWEVRPTFSIVLPTWNTPDRLLRACLDSVLAQTYPNWQLCIADDASTLSSVRQTLEAYVARDPRIHVNFRSVNGHISEASNTALAMATGDFVALLDHDDLLAPHALFYVALAVQARPSAKLLYSDEDKLDAAERRCDPFFKPDFSPDLLFSQNFFSHLGVYRRDIVEHAGGFRAGFEGSQDYDLVLRAYRQVDDPGDIVHIAKILYHWRMTDGSTARSQSEKDYASDAGRKALQDYFDRVSPQVSVSVVAPGIYRSQRSIAQPVPLVSLIVPTRDGYELLKMCIESIINKTTYPNFEILIVDNQSSSPQALAYMNDLTVGYHGKIRVIRFDLPFNFAAINNFAVEHARGEVLAFVNNDVEVISGDWLEEMVSHAMRPGIGCVGAKLYYPDDTVQHGGVILGVGGVANHAHLNFPRQSPGYFGRLWTIYNPSAVTAAVLVVRRDVFASVGGFDEESLPVAFNDVDLCLKVLRQGYRNLWTPFAELYHHESKSRGLDDTPEKKARFDRECGIMLDRWGPTLAADPSYNQNLSRHRTDFSLRID